MSRLHFSVREVSTIRGRGVLLSPGISDEDYDSVKPGQRVELRKPDGSVAVSSIVGIGYPPSIIHHEVRWVLMLEARIRTEDVPVGTEVWLQQAEGTE